MSFWVYILRCADNSYYTGHTDNLEKRIGEHQTGAIPSCYTFKRRPLKLVYSQDCATREEALAAEQQIKGWSRKKKEAMMRGDWAEVSRLAQSRTPVSPPNTVRPEPVEGQSPNSVRPEPVEGQHPNSVRPEPFEERPLNTVRPELVEGQHPSTARAEPFDTAQDGPVEASTSYKTALRQAQGERTGGGNE